MAGIAARKGDTMELVIAMIAGTLLFASWVLYGGARLTDPIRFWLAHRIARVLDAWEADYD